MDLLLHPCSHVCCIIVPHLRVIRAVEEAGSLSTYPPPSTMKTLERKAKGVEVGRGGKEGVGREC